MKIWCKTYNLSRSHAACQTMEIKTKNKIMEENGVQIDEKDIKGARLARVKAY